MFLVPVCTPGGARLHAGLAGRGESSCMLVCARAPASCTLCQGLVQAAVGVHSVSECVVVLVQTQLCTCWACARFRGRAVLLVHACVCATLVHLMHVAVLHAHPVGRCHLCTLTHACTTLMRAQLGAWCGLVHSVCVTAARSHRGATLLVHGSVHGLHVVLAPVHVCTPCLGMLTPVHAHTSLVHVHEPCARPRAPRCLQHPLRAPPGVPAPTLPPLSPQNGFAVIRPPGHHAEESTAM